jgi:carboxylesterase type B
MAPLSFRILLLATLVLGSPFAPSSPVVNLGYAKYQGTTLTGGVNQFLGMRFAQPPLGSLRWQAPQAPAKERGITPAESVSSLESQPRALTPMHPYSPTSNTMPVISV